MSRPWPDLGPPFKHTYFRRKMQDGSLIFSDDKLQAQYFLKLLRVGALIENCLERLERLNSLNVKRLSRYINFREEETIRIFGLEDVKIVDKKWNVTEEEKELWTRILNSLLLQLSDHVVQCSLISRVSNKFTSN